MLVRIRNYSPAPQGFYEDPEEAVEGVDNAKLPVHVMPGQTRDLKLSGVQLETAKALHKSRHIALAEVVDGKPGGDVAEEEMERVEEPQRDNFDEMSDETLRAFITTRDGVAPHHMLGRIKLLERARTEPKVAETTGEAASGEGEAV